MNFNFFFVVLGLVFPAFKVCPSLFGGWSLKFCVLSCCSSVLSESTAGMETFANSRSSKLLTKRNVDVLENIVSLDCEAFARKALVVRRRRYKRPSWCTLRFYVKRKLLKQKVVEQQWQFF